MLSVRTGFTPKSDGIIAILSFRFRTCRDVGVENARRHQAIIQVVTWIALVRVECCPMHSHPNGERRVSVQRNCIRLLLGATGKSDRSTDQFCKQLGFAFGQHNPVLRIG